jgi:hypothetical protein
MGFKNGACYVTCSLTVHKIILSFGLSYARGGAVWSTKEVNWQVTLGTGGEGTTPLLCRKGTLLNKKRVFIFLFPLYLISSSELQMWFGRFSHCAPIPPYGKCQFIIIFIIIRLFYLFFLVFIKFLALLFLSLIFIYFLH